MRHNVTVRGIIAQSGWGSALHMEAYQDRDLPQHN